MNRRHTVCPLRLYSSQPASPIQLGMQISQPESEVGKDVSRAKSIPIISVNVWNEMQRRSTFRVSTFEITIIGLLCSAEGHEEMKDAENKEHLSVTGVV